MTGASPPVPSRFGRKLADPEGNGRPYLQRQFGAIVNSLPTAADLKLAANEILYDVSDYDCSPFLIGRLAARPVCWSCRRRRATGPFTTWSPPQRRANTR